MSTITEALKAIKEVLALTDDMKRAGEALKQMSAELLQHDRRITRLEAQWDTAMQFSKLTVAKTRRLPRAVPGPIAEQ
ncbi:MAG: hypothetical protein LBE78_11785 [Burkholderiaceae bacterium]|jgi:hypothetical protein|nr:hypothetical protein [Burkholderiaceae bacterium]